MVTTAGFGEGGAPPRPPTAGVRRRGHPLDLAPKACTGGRYQAEKDLARTIDEFKTLRVDDSDPRDILDLSVRLARQSRDLRAARDRPGVDPVLAMLDNLARISSMLATDLVATAVTPKRWQRVFPDTPVSELLELLARHELKAVPVVGEKREVLGMVSDRDLLRFLLPQVV